MFQAAAVSVCQYLVSEVHKPVLTTHESEAGPATEPAKAATKKKAAKKAAVTIPSVAAPTPAPSRPQQPAPSAPPTPLVSQIMEMGFPRRHIEYAMQTTQSSNLERLVSWLLDHANLEVPEVNPPSVPAPAPASAPAPPAAAPPTVNKPAVRETAVDGSDSSSDSSDYSDDEEEDEDDGESMCVCVCVCVCDDIKCFLQVVRHTRLVMSSLVWMSMPAT